MALNKLLNEKCWSLEGRRAPRISSFDDRWESDRLALVYISSIFVNGSRMSIFDTPRGITC